MARWVRVLAVAGEAGATTRLASAGSFLVAVTCVLAVAAVVTASCALHSQFRRRRDNKSSTRSASPSETLNKSSSRRASPIEAFKFVLMSPGRALTNNSKKLSISEMREQSDQENEAYDCGAKEEEGAGDSLWQKRILMGDRCQPPSFSGHIVYDQKGNRLSQFPPRSPKRINLFHPSDQTDALQQP